MYFQLVSHRSPSTPANTAPTLILEFFLLAQDLPNKHGSKVPEIEC